MAVRATRLFLFKTCNAMVKYYNNCIFSKVSERLKNYYVEQTNLEPTNFLDIIKYEFLFLEKKPSTTSTKFMQINTM